MEYSKKVSAILLALILLITTFGTSVALADSDDYTLDSTTKTYLNAGDAKAGINSIGTYPAGTYHVYREYDGMLNISKFSGAAGAWINPSSTLSSSSSSSTSSSTSTSGEVRYTTSDLYVRSDASSSSSKLGIISEGERIVGRQVGYWFEFEYDGDTAYVAEAFTSTSYEDSSSTDTSYTSTETRYTTSSLYVRSGASSSSSKLGIIEEGAKLVGREVGYWFEFDYDGDTAYVAEAYTTSTKPSVTYTPEVAETSQSDYSVSSRRQQLVSFVKARVGYSYVYGATGPYSYDCSGLTQAAYRSIGISLNRTSRDQYAHGYSVSYNSMEPGDLIFFGDSASSIYHVGMYVGNREYVHASTPERGVVKDNVDSWWPRTYYYGVKRIVD